MKKAGILFAVVILVCGVGMGWYLSNQRGHEIDLGATEPTGGEFSLIAATGPVRLSDYTGKVVALYFGYTFCPDICPTSLSLLTQALNELAAEELDQVQAIFISVDPDRDTPDQLAKYTGYFHPKIIGVTGSNSTIAGVAKQYGAAYRKVEGESAGGYLVDHTSVTYIINPEGQLARSLSHGTPPPDIITAIRDHLPRSLD